MAVERMSVDGRYMYRLNAYNGRQIMWKPNRHNARWATLPEVYGTTEEAGAELQRLMREGPRGEGAQDGRMEAEE